MTDGCAVQLSDRTSARKISVADVPTPGGPYLLCHPLLEAPLNLTLRDCPKATAVLPRGSWWQCDMTARDHPVFYWQLSPLSKGYVKWCTVFLSSLCPQKTPQFGVAPEASEGLGPDQQ